MLLFSLNNPNYSGLDGNFAMRIEVVGHRFAGLYGEFTVGIIDSTIFWSNIKRSLIHDLVMLEVIGCRNAQEEN